MRRKSLRKKKTNTRKPITEEMVFDVVANYD